MNVCTTIHEVRTAINNLKKGGARVALVPTMGALHEGHLSLIRLARKHADHVIVSIFVNPQQFGPNEDFETYPRDLNSDIKKCETEQVNLIFAPEQSQMYRPETYLSIHINELNRYMCGGSRLGFFEGVLLVVNKLFNIIRPDVAVFGQKDIQQFQIIRHMVEEFNHNTKLLLAPIERANDGLALSSRNAYLSRDERSTAPGLYRSLLYIQKQIESGVTTPKLLIEHQKSELEAKGFKIDYLDMFSHKTLQPEETLQENRTYIIAGAAWLGNTRLIDNILIEI